MLADKIHYRALCNYIEKEFGVELTAVQRGAMIDIIIGGKIAKGKNKEEIMQG